MPAFFLAFGEVAYKNLTLFGVEWYICRLMMQKDKNFLKVFIRNREPEHLVLRLVRHQTKIRFTTGTTTLKPNLILVFVQGDET